MRETTATAELVSNLRALAKEWNPGDPKADDSAWHDYYTLLNAATVIESFCSEMSLRSAVIDECVQRLGQEYVEETYEPETAARNAAVGYCIGGLLALKNAAPQVPATGTHDAPSSSTTTEPSPAAAAPLTTAQVHEAMKAGMLPEDNQTTDKGACDQLDLAAIRKAAENCKNNRFGTSLSTDALLARGFLQLERELAEVTVQRNFAIRQHDTSVSNSSARGSLSDEELRGIARKHAIAATRPHPHSTPHALDMLDAQETFRAEEVIFYALKEAESNRSARSSK